VHVSHDTGLSKLSVTIIDGKWTWKHGWGFAVAKSKVFLPLQWKKNW